MKKIVALLLVLLIVAAGCTPSATQTTTENPVSTVPPVASTPASTTTPVSTTLSQTTKPVASTTPVATTTVAVAEGSLAQRLELLGQRMEEQRQEQHIPGMALVIVRNDEVIYSQGFGVSDLEKNTPVTPDTNFAIGSTTKAFTSTLVGMLVDEGKMDWNDPVSQYLPYFQMKLISEDPNARITLVDAMSHRSGYPRMGILTASGQVAAEEALKDASAAEPLAPFRSQFYYSNEIYTSAGLAAAQAAGRDWNTLIKTRILQPLGMDHTTTSYSEALQDSSMSRGYLWDSDLQQYIVKPLRNVDNIGPAASLNSNIVDMADWLRFQMSNGHFDGRTVISAASLLETHRSFCQIAPGIDYGLGWMLHEWEGQPMVEHGGNVDGFSAEVAFLPESHLGYVLLTNSTINQLPTTSQNMIWETILGDWASLNPVGSVAEYQPYLGRYIANFANFKNESFTVLVKNNRLAIDIPGQMVFELKAPDAQGKWYFAISDQISISFDRDTTGQVVGLKMYQSGLTFEIPREGVAASLEIPLADLQKYLGNYLSEGFGNLTVLVKNDHLALDIPGQMVYELYPPDAAGRWYFRVTDQIHLKFNAAADGSIESLTLSQGGLESVMPRNQASDLPVVEDILRLRQTDQREATLKTLGNLRFKGTVSVVQSGVKGTLTASVDTQGNYRIDEDYGKYGSAITSIKGEQACLKSSFGPFQEYHGKMLKQALQNNPRYALGDWRKYYDSIRVISSDTFDGLAVYVMELQNENLPAITIYVDARNGDILKSSAVSIQEGGISILITTTYADFKEINGLRMAMRETSSNDQSGIVVMEYQSVDTRETLADDYFILTP